MRQIDETACGSRKSPKCATQKTAAFLRQEVLRFERVECLIVPHGRFSLFGAFSPQPVPMRFGHCTTRRDATAITERRASRLQVCDPHNGDHAPIIEYLLFGALVAGPDEILFGRKGL